MNRLSPAARWAAGLLLLAALGYLAYRVRATLAALAAGLIVAYIIEPLVSRLERWRIPRSIGAVVLAFLVVGIIAGVVLIAVPAVAAEVTHFTQRVSLQRLVDPAAWPPTLRDYLARHQAEVYEYKQTAVAWLKANAGRLAASTGAVLARVFSSVASLVVALLNLVIVPVIAYYLVVDYGALRRGIAGLVPPRARAETSRLMGEVDAALRAFIRGQSLVALGLGVMYAAGLALLGTPLGVLVGLAAGLLSVVPYLGLAAGLAPSLLLNFLEHQSWGRLLGVVLVFVIAQQIEGFVLTPRLVGTSVGLHPVVVVIAIMLGGELFGFAGILLGVPAAAIVSVFAREALARYKASRLFLEEGPGGQERSEA